MKIITDESASFIQQDMGITVIGRRPASLTPAEKIQLLEEMGINTKVWVNLNTLEDLLGVKYKAIGSIEGKIELINIHPKTRKFDIYELRTNKAVRCNFPSEIEQDVFMAAEKRKRVVIFGVISYNSRGEPISILVKTPIRFLPQEKDLPTAKDLRGMSPDFTGDMKTEDYIRSLRE